MRDSAVCAAAKLGFLIVLISFFPLIASCGESNGGNPGDPAGGGQPSSAGLFITDDFSDTFRQVLVTIYKVEFEESGGTVQTVFNDENGVTYDLRRLSGILSPLSGGAVPAGSYRAVRITVGERVILVDNAGTTFSPTFAQTPSTTCGAGRCVIAIGGAFEVSAENPVVLDFDLKQFVFDPATNTVTAQVVVDPDGSHHGSYAEENEDDFELKGVVQTVRPDGFDLAVFHAKSFTPPDYTVSVTVTGETQYGCDDDDQLP